MVTGTFHVLLIWSEPEGTWFCDSFSEDPARIKSRLRHFSRFTDLQLKVVTATSLHDDAPMVEFKDLDPPAGVEFVRPLACE